MGPWGVDRHASRPPGGVLAGQSGCAVGWGEGIGTRAGRIGTRWGPIGMGREADRHGGRGWPVSGRGRSASASAVLEVLAAAGVPVTPAGLAAATGLASRTVSKALGELRAEGLVVGPKPAPALSLAGRAAAGRRLPAPSGSWDARVGGLLPVWHAAAVRLMADAVVARAVGPAGPVLPGFVIFGPVATFKSTLADLVVAMFGLDRASTVVANSSSLTAGAVIGRRERAEGGWRFVRSGYVGQRFVCFDELADADPAVVREVTQLLYGERVVLVEGERVSVAPVTVACFNPPPGRRWPVLSEGTWRRVLRLDTGAVADVLPAGLGRRVGAFLAAAPAPVELARLSWPTLELPGRLRSVWDDVEAALSDQGRAWHDARVFDTLVLGRAARYGHDAGEMDADSFAVAVDMLCLAETVEGLVAHPDWRVDVDTVGARLGGLPGGPEALAAVAARDAARVELERVARQQQTAREQLSVELVGARAELGERLAGAAKTITYGLVEKERPDGARLRAQLRDLARRAGEARSLERLAELDALAGPVLAEAAALAAAIAQRRRADAAVAEQAKRDAKRARAANAEIARRRRQADQHTARQAKAAEAERRRQLKELDGLARRVRTRPGEDVVGRLVQAGCLSRVVEEIPVQRHGFWARVEGKVGQVEIHRRVRYLDAAGRYRSPMALSAWGQPEVVEVIAARRAQLVAGDRPALPAVTQLALPAVPRSRPPVQF